MAIDLHLNLKAEWYDMILSGVKKEEYRDLKPYWIKRFLDIKDPEGYNENIPSDIQFDIIENNHDPSEVLISYYSEIRAFDRIIFSNGYSKSRRQMIVECKEIIIGLGKEAWGGTSDSTFIIKLGKIHLTINHK